MKVIEVDVNKIKPYKNNPRVNDNAVDKVAESIKQFGFKQPLVLDSDYNIVVGHTRLKASLSLNYKKVPCIIADDLTDEKIKAYRLADNKTNELAEWDIEKLNIELGELKELDIDFDMSDFGFDLNIENENIEVEEDNFDFDKESENIEEPTTKLGDIWILGNHRLMCGDSFELEQINILLNNEKIDMVFTDPPYDMQMGGQGCFSESTKNLKKRIDKIINFDVNKLKHIKEIGVNTFYICTSKNGIKDYFKIFDEYNFNILVWCKTNPTPFTAGTFLPDVEYILYFSKGKKIWNNSLKPTDIYKRYYISSKEFGRNEVGNLHPTMKPLELISNRILISSNKNGNVLDLFGGSGSTLIACEQTNRNCYMMELDEKYCDVIVKRWETLTGLKAVLESE